MPIRRIEHGGISMEFTKELKEKIEKAETKEEVKKIMEEAGIILDDAELDQVSGGVKKNGSSGNRPPISFR